MKNWKISPSQFDKFFFFFYKYFTQSKAKKIVKLKTDENVNFDFRIFNGEKLHF